MFKKSAAILMALVLGIGGLTACGSSNSEKDDTQPSKNPEAEATVEEEANAQEEAPASKGDLKIGVIDRTADEEVHIKFGDSIKAACKEAGIECLYSTPGEDLSLVRSTYDSYVSQGCNVIVDFLSALEVSQALAEDCRNDGVFHICIDADAGEDSYFYGLSNGDAGEKLGTYLIDYVNNKMGGVCDMLILMDSPSHGEDVAKRTEVPKEMLIEAGLVSEGDVGYISLTNYDLESVRQETTDFLTTHADKEHALMISFASSFNDAIYSASKAQGFDDKLNLFSYDAMDVTVGILKSGEKSVTKGEVSSGIDRYGYEVLEIAEKLLRGEEVPRYSYSDSFVVDAENVNEKFPD